MTSVPEETLISSRIPIRCFPVRRLFADIGEYLEQRYFTELWVCSLTHTVTHTQKCPERDREHQTGS